MPNTELADNPFRIHGAVLRPFFTNRESELDCILAAFREPGVKLLVYGDRRMGKTSTLTVALGDYEEEDGLGIMADLSTASTVADMATRVLDAALRRLGRRWKDVISDIVHSIGLSVTVGADPMTGLPTASLDIRLRDADVADQRETFGRVLDSIDQAAAERNIHVAVVLDEFQEIHRFGGEDAEWHLRGVIQQHRHISYVLAGSKPDLIRRMLGKGRAFYGLLDKLPFGPIDAIVMAAWIDERMQENGVNSSGAGERIVDIAGPRTRDVVRLARKTFDLARSATTVDGDIVERAFAEIIQDEDDPIFSLWEGLTSHQQNVLRAVAAATKGLTTAGTLRRFSLSSSSAVSRTAGKFIQDSVLERGGVSGFRFDSPYFRGWVVTNALPDMGVHLPPTFQADSAE